MSASSINYKNNNKNLRILLRIFMLFIVFMLISSFTNQLAMAEEGSTPVVTNIEISGPDSILIPVSGSVTTIYEAIVNDGAITDENVIWSVSNTTGVCVDSASGVVTVDNTARATSFTLQARSTSDNTVFHTKTIKLEIYISGRVYNLVTDSGVAEAKVQRWPDMGSGR